MSRAIKEQLLDLSSRQVGFTTGHMLFSGQALREDTSCPLIPLFLNCHFHIYAGYPVQFTRKHSLEFASQEGNVFFFPAFSPLVPTGTAASPYTGRLIASHDSTEHPSMFRN